MASSHLLRRTPPLARVARLQPSATASSSSSSAPFPLSSSSRSRRNVSLLTAAKLKYTPESQPNLPAGIPQTASPLKMIKTELSALRSNIAHLLGSGHPALDTVAKYYFQAEGKHIRPTIVLLMAQATNGLGSHWDSIKDRPEEDIDRFLTQRKDVLNDENPSMPESTQSFSDIFIPSLSPDRLSPPPPPTRLPPSDAPSQQTPFADRPLDGRILATQRRLAEITEMFHVASLLHDDVIDESPTRRGQTSAPSQFGNKVSVLAGDFLLGRSSAALARLGSEETVELMSAVIANLVEGEMLQLQAIQDPERRPTKEGFDRYLQKTYLKTASLMAKSARSAVVLGGAGGDEGLKDVAYAYGRNLGIAFQLVDDLLDFTPTPSELLGKPSSGFDLSLGLATAPLLFAWESNASLTPYIARRFAHEGDVQTVRDLVIASDGLAKTRDLARRYAEEAARIVRERLPESSARKELEKVAQGVVDRCK